MLAGFALPLPPSATCYCCCCCWGSCPFLQQTLPTGQLATISFSIHSCPVLRHVRMQLRRDELLLKTFTGFISDFCCCCPGLLQDMPGLGRTGQTVGHCYCCLYLFYYLFVFVLCSFPSALRICLLITHVIMSTASGHVSLCLPSLFPLSSSLSLSVPSPLSSFCSGTCYEVNNRRRWNNWFRLKTNERGVEQREVQWVEGVREGGGDTGGK